MSEMLPELEKDRRGGSLNAAERLCLFLQHCSGNNLQVIEMLAMRMAACTSQTDAGWSNSLVGLT